jgi:hypothetical protein
MVIILSINNSQARARQTSCTNQDWKKYIAPKDAKAPGHLTILLRLGVSA